MTQYIDKHDIQRDLSFTKSDIEDRINLTMFAPKKQLKGDVWDMPIEAAKELRDNLNQLIGEKYAHSKSSKG